MQFGQSDLSFSQASHLFSHRDHNSVEATPKRKETAKFKLAATNTDEGVKRSNSVLSVLDSMGIQSEEDLPEPSDFMIKQTYKVSSKNKI